MSYAIIQSGGKQYKVKAGEILKIEKLEESKPESKIEFKEILAYGDDKNIEIGAPLVSGLESSNLSILRISPAFTLYCFPPVCIIAYDIVLSIFYKQQYSLRLVIVKLNKLKIIL